MYHQSVRRASRRHYVLLAVVLLVAASLAGGRALWFLAYAMLAAPLYSLVHGLLGLLALKGSIKAPAAGIAAGDMLSLSYELINNSALSFPLIEFVEGGGFTRGDKKSVCISLEPRSTVRWESPLRVERRGKYRYGEAQIVIRDIYGLFALRRRIRSPITITVYPRIIPLENLRPEGLRQLGELLVGDPFARDLSELSSIRAYQDGDPLHYMHWRLSARGGDPLIKQFARRGEVSMDIVLDSEAAHYEADTDGRLADLGAEAAISLLDFLLARSARCRLFLTSGARAIAVDGRDASGLPAFMEALADFNPGDRTGAGDLALQASSTRSDSKASIVLISPTISRDMALKLIKLKLEGRRAAFVRLCGPERSAVYESDEKFLRVLKAEGITTIALHGRKELGRALGNLR
jgi:uncharacterized protein (DUF58 family)